jgi:DNA-directed DNA polymerase III PolC
MVHLHVHSHHSLLEGAAGIRQLVGRAVEYGMKALALTDTGGLYGAIPFYKAARAAGVRPVIGVQLGDGVWLARDREGYAQLCEIITSVQLGKVRKEQLGEWPFPFGGEHLFVLTADRATLRALRAHGVEPLAAITHRDDRTSRYRAGELYDFAHREGLRPVAVSPVYFLEPEHYRIHRVLAAIRHNTTVGQLTSDEVARPEDWFRPPRDLERQYADWPDALENAEWVAEECALELPLGKPVFPPFALSAGETSFSWLWKCTFEGLKRRYQPLTPAIIDRVRYELHIIDSLGFSGYFLIMGDIVQFAREQGIPVVGRGSAANSVVAHALGITRVDPFKYNLYFERFLNPGRTDCPDIDLDICWRRRDEVLEYVYRRYGAEQVAMIATFNTFQARSAVREVAKALGLTGRQIGEVTQRLPHYHSGDLRTVLKQIPECRGISQDEEPLKSILEISEFIDGFPRHLSIHAGGVVIAPERLTRFVPLQRAAKGLIITQFDMHPIEDLGLVKMDLLGHRSLSVIADTVQSVRDNRGRTLDIEAVPDRDPLTAAMLRSGKTLACFQIESPAMRGLLQKVSACDIHTLVQCVALVRPGASGSGMKQHFIDRHHGREAVTYLHPALREVLGDTYGVMVYQEDVLKVAHAVAGIDLSEADNLRRTMTKKRGPREMAKSMKRFLEKARENGVEEATAQAIWELIANFAAYAYCKAHAATYGELAYQCAYLKAHYPAEFFAAVLSNRGGFYLPPVYLEEAKRVGIEVRPPDINRSRYPYTAEDDALRVGFIEIRTLSQAAIEAVLDARETGPFRDLADFQARAHLGWSDAEALFQAGAFDAFGPPRPVQLWQLKTLYAAAPPRGVGESPLLSGGAPPSPSFPDYSVKHRTDLEWTAMGFLTAGHPFQYHLPWLLKQTLIPSTDLPRYEGQIVTLAGWLIAERRLAVKDGHGVMKFITLEDTHGAYEAVLFPEVYQACGHHLVTHGPYLITGEVQQEHGAYTLIVHHLQPAPGRDLPRAQFAPTEEEGPEETRAAS